MSVSIIPNLKHELGTPFSFVAVLVKAMVAALTVGRKITYSAMIVFPTMIVSSFGAGAKLVAGLFYGAKIAPQSYGSGPKLSISSYSVGSKMVATVSVHKS